MIAVQKRGWEKRPDAGKQLDRRRGVSMTNDLRALGKLDRMIHEPRRLIIMTVLYAVAEADFLYLQKGWGFTQRNLSSHLAKLEAAKYVTMKRAFKGKYPMMVCGLMKQGREAFEAYARMLRYVSGATEGSNSGGS
jgi:DNA-binding transcriptional ArsR family regulator